MLKAPEQAWQDRPAGEVPRTETAFEIWSSIYCEHPQLQIASVVGCGIGIHFKGDGEVLGTPAIVAGTIDELL